MGHRQKSGERRGRGLKDNMEMKKGKGAWVRGRKRGNRGGGRK